MQPELGSLPLLERLEHERHGAQVRHAERRQRLDGFRVVLRRRAANKSEARQVDDGVDRGRALRVEEVVLDGAREVESARVDADDARAAGFELRDERNVVPRVARVDVGFLEHDADRRRVDREPRGRGVLVEEPLLVVVDRVEDLGSHRVPDALIGQEHGLRDGLLEDGAVRGVVEVVADLGHVRRRQIHEHRPQVVGRAAEPVLERRQERFRVLRFVAGQIFKNFRERPQ
mmetsp:Transcript_11267/g.45617  ORF Transcript_11267/g.45617 Transcript_11267/m.45617 type:complete len:231 (+) Transcript_11267:3373-4065(+)